MSYIDTTSMTSPRARRRMLLRKRFLRRPMAVAGLAVVLVAAAGYVIVNLAVDVVYSLLNPRIRVAGART